MLSTLLVIAQLTTLGADAQQPWWQQPVRMLRVDEAPDFSKLKEADLDEMARSRRDDWGINCEWIEGSFGWEGRGYLTSFKTPLFEQWPGFGDFDYLRAYTPAAHKYGIHVISYLNMHWFDFGFADKHPGWEQLMSSGTAYGRAHPLYGNGTTFCVNGPWRDWAFSMIGEAMKTGIDGVFLDGPVIFPDSCYCETCQKLFREKYGKDIPKEDWANPLWRDFLEFREDSMARFLADARKVVRDIKPDGVVFLNAGTWSPGGWRVARDIQKMEPHQEFTGAEAFFHHGANPGLYDCLMTGKYLRASSNPAVVFTHYMNGSWHYRVLDPCEVQLEIIQTLASGSNPWLALIHSSLTSQPEAAKPVKEIYDFAERNKAWYTNVESAAEVAVLISSGTGRNYLSFLDGVYDASTNSKEENLVFTNEKHKAANLVEKKQESENLLTSAYEGYFALLTRSHVPFDIILDQDLVNGTLARYKTLILPDAACLGTDAAENVRKFVDQGGSLLASFEAGFYDNLGRPSQSLLDVLGIAACDGAFPVVSGDNYVEAIEEHWGFAKGCLIERGPYALKVNAREGVNTPARFQEAMERPYEALKGLSNYPAVLMSTHAAGKVVYFPEALGTLYGRTHMTTAEQRFEAALDWLTGERPIQIQAPRTVSAEVYRKQDAARNNLIIHLVNNTVDGRPAGEFLPVYDIKLRLKIPAETAVVTWLGNGESTTSKVEGGYLEITLPKLVKYEVVTVEY